MPARPPVPAPTRRLPALAAAALYAALLLAAYVSGRAWLAGLAAFVLLGLLLGAGLRRGRPLAWGTWLAGGAGLLLLGHYGQVRLALDALPVLINALLCGVFARTLRAGREPLIARVIAVLEGAERLELPRVASYARALTAAWALLLGGQALGLATVLLCAVPDGALAAFGRVPPLALEGTAWHGYLRWGGYALVPAFLMLEYAFRRCWLRALPHAPLPLFLVRLAQRWPALLHSVGACRTYGIESENSTVRGQIFDDSPADSGSIGQEAAEIWTAQADLQPILHKSDRLLAQDAPRAGA